MSKPGLAFGLNLTKKPGAPKQPPPKSRSMFGDNDDDSDHDGANHESTVEEIGGDLEDFGTTRSQPDSRKSQKPKNGIPTQPPKLKSKIQTSTMFGDLSSSLTSRQNAEKAAEVDSTVYEYDSVYDSLKPKKENTKEDAERRPKYMRSLMQAAEVRKRDALIAEEKKIAREREAEGDEYEDKEKFVTEAYKKQQEENRRIEEEERRKEEQEAKKNQGGGMSAFYRNMLNKDEQRHAEAVKSAEKAAKQGPKLDQQEEERNEEKTEADMAKEMNEKGASIALNEEGQVVDKRQLLKGGLNLGSIKKKDTAQQHVQAPSERDRRQIGGVQIGKKQALRERQSRMLAEQLEQSMKRSREDEDAQRQETERAAKSQKTEGEISSAKERYLARKKAAEEAKKKGITE